MAKGATIKIMHPLVVRSPLPEGLNHPFDMELVFHRIRSHDSGDPAHELTLVRSYQAHPRFSKMAYVEIMRLPINIE
jgi:hypothetical protein